MKKPSVMKNKLNLKILHSPFLHCFFLAAIAFLVYSNNYKHDYHLDSCHLILDNPAVRSLKNIPSFFSDPRTLSVLRSNIDYRPVLQVTYALNYRISGYATWSWHLVQIILHAVCVVSLYLFCLLIMRQFVFTDGRRGEWGAFIIALLFAVHPTGSGVINYLSARSSLLVAALLMPSLLLYTKRYEDPRYAKTPFASALLYTLALFTKVEAVGCLPVYLFCDMLQTARKRSADGKEDQSNKGPLYDAIKTCNLTTFRRFSPFILSTAVYFIIRSIVMADYNSSVRYSDDMTPMIYLFTQVTAWWYYVRNWIAPVNLIADTLTYPIFRSLADPTLLLAIGGWLFVAFIARRTYRKSPYLLFILLAAWTLIAPTSTIAPLAEMVNEHRPYLPMALFAGGWLILLIQSGFIPGKNCRPASIFYVCSLIVIITSLFLLTRQRNAVFSTTETYYQDILKKAPSARAYANYGLFFLRKGKFEQARNCYQKALEMAPEYYIAHINLGVIYQFLNDDKAARFHLDRAVATDGYSATARIYRGEFLASKLEFKAALADFESVLPLHREKYQICKGAAVAAFGLGEWAKATDYLTVSYREDPKRLESDIVNVSKLFWARPDLCDAGLHFYAAVNALYPDRWWVHYNIADLAGRCGDAEQAAKESQMSQSLKQAGNNQVTAP